MLAALTVLLTAVIAAPAEASIFWGNRGFLGQGTTVGRANLDGTGINPSFTAGGSGPCGVAVDSGHVYWANYGTNGAGSTIGRANLDGTGVNQNFVTGADGPCGVAVDGSHIYWANSGGSTGRANLDGTSPVNGFIILSAIQNPCGVAVDGGHVYWANYGISGAGSTIGRADLDETPRAKPREREPELHRRRPRTLRGGGRLRARLLGQHRALR